MPQHVYRALGSLATSWHQVVLRKSWCALGFEEVLLILLQWFLNIFFPSYSLVLQKSIVLPVCIQQSDSFLEEVWVARVVT